MVNEEILKKVRKIQIKTNRLADNLLAGMYASAFKGVGIEFSEVRQYLPGDEIRSIDWNVTARMGQPYVKEFEEEREQTILLLVDASSSFRFGTVNQLKNELTAEICALLAFSAIENNDKVGLVIFTDQIEKHIPPRKGRRHVLRVIRELLYFKPTHYRTDISGVLEYINKVTHRSTICFLISDFIDSGYEKAFQIASKRHDLIPVTITDPKEEELPSVGLINLKDAETGEEILIDSSNQKVREEYKRRFFEMVEFRKKVFASAGVSSIDLRTDRDYVDVLMKFFKARKNWMQ
ncbi:hypothetical protein BBF96_07515 [Anoxybacter fermentans]|uniref:DUF58 domain-containing protein n=2 Tax=Anoxybacter fermentans TaxID=1323375 RepID=A0A3Q9HQQ0_9FIRM|nr:hypothetical protein BBF96_07515 [Anoxybacter fermentans]